MREIFITTDLREERYRKRAGKARKWAFVTFVLLVGMSLSAVWQDKNLAPPVRAQMAQAMRMIEDQTGLSDRMQEYMTAVSDFTQIAD